MAASVHAPCGELLHEGRYKRPPASTRTPTGFRKPVARRAAPSGEEAGCLLPSTAGMPRSEATLRSQPEGSEQESASEPRDPRPHRAEVLLNPLRRRAPSAPRVRLEGGPGVRGQSQEDRVRARLLHGRDGQRALRRDRAGAGQARVGDCACPTGDRRGYLPADRCSTRCDRELHGAAVRPRTGLS